MEDEIHKDVKLTEVEVADKLLDFRSKQAGFIDTSFDTISGISIPVTLMTFFFSSYFKDLDHILLITKLKKKIQIMLLNGINSVILITISQFIGKI